MDIKTQEQIFKKSIVDIFHSEEDYNDNIDKDIQSRVFAAMTAWERQQNHVLSERVYELERDKSITELQLVHSDQRIKELEEGLRELMEGVAGLPPLTAIAGVLEKQYTKAKHLLTPSVTSIH